MPDQNIADPNEAGPITQHLMHKYYDLILGRHHDGAEKRRNSNVQEQEQLQEILDNPYPITTTGMWSQLSLLCRKLFTRDYEKNIIVDKLTQEKQHATSYEDWLAAALRLDDLTHTTDWKAKEESTLYDYKLVREHTLSMRHARETKDYAQLLYLIRTAWVRNLGNMGNVNLYRHSHVGTKHLIDEYMEESKCALEELVYRSDLDDNYLLGMLIQTRKNIGRTALVLSGGGTFGLFHIGVLATLFEQDLLPRVISGSSAGAIVASIMCSHHKSEIVGILEGILQKDFNIFQDDSEKSEGENLLIKISRFFKNGTWFDNKHLVKTMIEFLGDLTFREAYNRTGKILNITVSPASVYEQPRLLNNLTAPNVLIWSAVCASCSLPGIFPSTPLYEKDPKTGEAKQWNSSSVKFVDGSVDNDLPISRLSEMFNVDHIIACQVNIHVFPFLKLSVSCVGGEIEDELSARFRQSLSSIYNFMVNEVIHALEIATELGIATNALTKFRSVLSQQYSGDITILPDMKVLLRFNEILVNPTVEFLLRETVNGARATWPKISIIKNHCGQEFELDRAISYLKGRLISKPSSIKNPFQFADLSISLINTPEMNNNDEHMPNILDDNILNPQFTDGLMVISDKHRPLSSGRAGINIPDSRMLHHNRRKSDSYSKDKASSRGLVSHSAISSPYISNKVVPTVMGYHPKLNRQRSTDHTLMLNEARPFAPGKKHSSSFSSLHYERLDLRSQSLTLALGHTSDNSFNRHDAPPPISPKVNLTSETIDSVKLNDSPTKAFNSSAGGSLRRRNSKGPNHYTNSPRHHHNHQRRYSNSSRRTSTSSNHGKAIVGAGVVSSNSKSATNGGDNVKNSNISPKVGDQDGSDGDGKFEKVNTESGKDEGSEKSDKSE